MSRSRKDEGHVGRIGLWPVGWIMCEESSLRVILRTTGSRQAGRCLSYAEVLYGFADV